MTLARLIAIRRFLTFEEPCDPPMAKEEIDVILRLAEQQIVNEEQNAKNRAQSQASCGMSWLANLAGLGSSDIQSAVDQQLGISPYSPGRPYR